MGVVCGDHICQNFFWITIISYLLRCRRRRRRRRWTINISQNILMFEMIVHWNGWDSLVFRFLYHIFDVHISWGLFYWRPSSVMIDKIANFYLSALIYFCVLSFIDETRENDSNKSHKHSIYDSITILFPFTTFVYYFFFVLLFRTSDFHLPKIKRPNNTISTK